MLTIWLPARDESVGERRSVGVSAATVWKLLERHAAEVADVAMEGTIPLDVDTWEDYRRVLLAAVQA